MHHNSRPTAVHVADFDAATTPPPVLRADRPSPEHLTPPFERKPPLGDQVEARGRLSRLRASNQDLYTLIGIAGHEIRTPLTAVKATVQLASRLLARRASQSASQAESEAEQHVSEVVRAHALLLRADQQIARLDRLVDDLLDVSRIDAGTLAPRLEQCNLLAIVAVAVADQQLTWPTRAIAWDGWKGWDARDDAVVNVLAEPQRIGQVVTNYLTNALKYSPADKPVHIWVEVADGEARVCVRDEGPGLPAAEQARIWDRFQQAAGIDQQAGTRKGLGLGLYLCRAIIEQHHGRVGVESAPGHGSTFWCALPLLASGGPRKAKMQDAGSDRNGVNR